jgi:arsenate reductase
MNSPKPRSAQGAITIYHNPACGTSRNVLAALREGGHEPNVVEYLKVGWRREQLQDLLRRMGLRARDILRVRGTPAEALGLAESGVSEARILDAMVADPILVERPIVDGPKGVALCRPAERVRDLI